MVEFIKGSKKLYDIQSMIKILNINKSKIQRELKLIDGEIVKYKNLHLHPEKTLFSLMEKILIEKLEKSNDRF
jgi:hypothetical protein